MTDDRKINVTAALQKLREADKLLEEAAVIFHDADHDVYFLNVGEARMYLAELLED